MQPVPEWKVKWANKHQPATDSSRVAAPLISTILDPAGVDLGIKDAQYVFEARYARASSPC